MANLKSVVALAAALLLISMLSSCLPIPLGDPEKSQTDAKLSGYWHLKQDSGGVLITIAPADSHVYVIDYLEYKKAGDDLTAAHRYVLRGWLTELKGQRFLTTEMIAQLLDKPENKDYVIFKVAIENDQVTATPLADKYDAFKDLKDPAALAQAIEQHLDDPKMYDDPSVFTRLDPGKEQDKTLIDLFAK